MRRILFAVVVLALATANATAWANVITHCGASEGMAYRLEGELVPRDQQGWQEDRISDGELLLDYSAKEKAWDVLYKDGSSWKSHEAEGFLTIGVPKDGNILVMGLNPATAVVEHFVFELDDKGNGQVVWGTSRAGLPFPKGSLMVASCKAP